MRRCVLATRSPAVVGAGLAEDRYATGRGFWRLIDGCDVTLIHAEDLARAERRHGLSLNAGAHRRNLVVSGLARDELRGRHIRIGDALLEWHRVRPPCGYLDRVSRAGTVKALRRLSGHCLRVRESGRIKVGDSVSLFPPEGTPSSRRAIGARPPARSAWSMKHLIETVAGLAEQRAPRPERMPA